MMRSLKILATAVCTVVVTGIQTTEAAWNAFVIREGGGNPPVIQTNNTYVPNATEFVIATSGQKAAFGSSDIDGAKLGDITQLSVARLDDRTRFTPGSGPAVAPYINIWITDGTHHAIVANEPSDSVFQPLYNNGYNLTFADLANKPAKIFEITDKSWLPNNGVNLTFADLANFTIDAPTTAELTSGWAGLGSGAPRQLGTNVAYGVNWVVGDTLSNYVSGNEGYVLNNPVAAVPEPSSLALIGVGAAALLRRRRRTAGAL